MIKFIKRTVAALIMLAVIAALLYFNGWALAIAIGVIALVAQFEVGRAVSRQGSPVCVAVQLAGALLIAAGFFFYGFEGAFAAFALTLAMLFAVTVFAKKYDTDSLIKGIFSFAYPQVFFVFFYAILFRGDGVNLVSADVNRFIIIATAAISVLTDTMAYLIGSLIGKHKLCPHISPKKSVEGAVAGLVGGAIGAGAVILIFNMGTVSVIGYFIFAILASALSQLGDLAASLVKRRFDVKDFSKLLGEHGGIMDRIDSFIYILPFSYMFFFMVSGL